MHVGLLLSTNMVMDDSPVRPALSFASMVRVCRPSVIRVVSHEPVHVFTLLIMLVHALLSILNLALITWEDVFTEIPM